jgi:uncharacterized membrane protein YphA (DoxX/SURF4 family)
MRHLVRFARFAFGGWFLVSGLNQWLHVFPQPLGANDIARQFTLALMDSHLFLVVKAIELIAGAFILLNRFTPLMLVACLPISVVIFFWDVVLDRETVELTFGPLTLVINGLLMLAYYRYYRPMLEFRARAIGEKDQ